MSRYWLVLPLTFITVVTGGTDEDIWDCGKIVIDFLSDSEQLQNYRVVDYTASTDGNSLTLKEGVLFGFYDLNLARAEKKKDRKATELTVTLEVPELELSSLNYFEDEDGSTTLLTLSVTGRDVRFKLGLRYNDEGIRVTTSRFLDMDTASVVIEDVDADLYKFSVTPLARDMFQSVITETVPLALNVTARDPDLHDALDREDC
ncbi:uncharacterized protein LOC135387443 [Ornithodoros turicata]|uniref:uncharacterized protein LOC135387443 n=1 Tax=Ornithodoros turicata TaxID=34597 RepID=UPI0031386BF9